jgi:transcriptional antiterminator RfaH
MPWYVLYTNPKAEKKAAQQLAAMGFEVYCPVVQQVRQWSDRKKLIEVPLFTSYVFINIEDSKRHEVFTVKGIVRYLFWLGQPAVVKQQEIEEIKKWLSTKNVQFEVEPLHEGDTVEIKEGQFKGRSGIVQQVNKNYIRIIIESIGFVLVVRSKKDVDVT